MRGYYRQTKIVATVGPPTEIGERLRQLIVSGMDVIRLNMAQGTGEWVKALVKRIREVYRARSASGVPENCHANLPSFAR